MPSLKGPLCSPMSLPRSSRRTTGTWHDRADPLWVPNSFPWECCQLAWPRFPSVRWHNRGDPKNEASTAAAPAESLESSSTARAPGRFECLRECMNFYQEPKPRGKHLSLCFQVKQTLKGFASLGAAVADGTLLCSVLHVPRSTRPGMLCSWRLATNQPPTAFPA